MNFKSIHVRKVNEKLEVYGLVGITSDSKAQFIPLSEYTDIAQLREDHPTIKIILHEDQILSRWLDFKGNPLEAEGNYYIATPKGFQSVTKDQYFKSDINDDCKVTGLQLKFLENNKPLLQEAFQKANLLQPITTTLDPDAVFIKESELDDYLFENMIEAGRFYVTWNGPKQKPLDPIIFNKKVVGVVEEVGAEIDGQWRHEGVLTQGTPELVTEMLKNGRFKLSRKTTHPWRHARLKKGMKGMSATSTLKDMREAVATRPRRYPSSIHGVAVKTIGKVGANLDSDARDSAIQDRGEKYFAIGHVDEPEQKASLFVHRNGHLETSERGNMSHNIVFGLDTGRDYPKGRFSRDTGELSFVPHYNNSHEENMSALRDAVSHYKKHGAHTVHVFEAKKDDADLPDELQSHQKEFAPDGSTTLSPKDSFVAQPDAAHYDQILSRFSRGLPLNNFELALLGSGAKDESTAKYQRRESKHNRLAVKNLKQAIEKGFGNYNDHMLDAQHHVDQAGQFMRKRHARLNRWLDHKPANEDKYSAKGWTTKSLSQQAHEASQKAAQAEPPRIQHGTPSISQPPWPDAQHALRTSAIALDNFQRGIFNHAADLHREVANEHRMLLHRHNQLGNGDIASLHYEAARLHRAAFVKSHAALGESKIAESFKIAWAKYKRKPVNESVQAINESSLAIKRKNESSDFELSKSYTQYIQRGNVFSPAGPVTLQPNLQGFAYAIKNGPSGPVFEKVKPKTDDLYKFKDSVMEAVLKEIDTFWGLKENFNRLGLLHHRGVIMHGPPGCHAKGTRVVMYDGTLKNIEEVQVGDVLIGPDSTPREVLRLVRGREEMFCITPRKGPAFIVNAGHMLSLKPSGEMSSTHPSPLNVSVRNFVSLGKPSQERLKLWRTGVEFKVNQEMLLVDPYYLGVWLGDGTSCNTGVTTADAEIVEMLESEAGSAGLRVVTRCKNGGNKAKTYHIVGDYSKGGNTLLTRLKKIGVLENKHIPEQYLTASREHRLELLAGIIDTDGAYTAMHWRRTAKNKKGVWKGCYEVSQVRKLMADGICRLAASLGFGVTRTICEKSIKSTGFRGKYHKIIIRGDISEVPVRLPRKKSSNGQPNKDTLRSGIAKVESVGLGDYFGFTLSGDHLYLTDDFVVHHNCGKSSVIQQVVEMMVGRGDVVFFARNIGTLKDAMEAFREVEPNRQVVVVLEDADEYIGHSEREMLQIMDGDSSFDNVLFLATTNYLDRFPPRLLRPGRFDKHVHVGPINYEGRLTYLKSKLTEVETPERIEELARETDGFSFGHLRELVVGAYAMKEPVSEVMGRLRGSTSSEVSGRVNVTVAAQPCQH